MTVENQVPYQSFTANGLQTNFALGFYVDDKDHFEVKKNDQAVAKNDYSYRSSSNSIVFSTTPEQGDLIEIQRNTAADRATNYATYNNSFRPEVLNKDIDRIWLKIQELGVADQLLKIYADRLHIEQKSYIDNEDQAIKNIVNDLRNYVNQQDNALTASLNNLRVYTDQQDNNRNSYFENLIRQQGISLEHLDQYYQHLLQSIAKIVAEKGWDSSFVVHGGQLLQEILNNQKNRNDKVIYASEFGIKGDGTDESVKVIQAFNKIQNGFTLDFEGKEITVDTQISINKTNFSLRNGTLKKKNGSTTDKENYILQLKKCRNFFIENFHTDGNRTNRIVKETATHNVNLRQCKDFVISGCKWTNSTCDALQMDCITAETLDKSLHTENGIFINCHFSNSYRNNVSIIIAHDLQFINCKFIGANGTLPASGVDLETNRYGGIGLINNIVFDQCEFKDNKGWQAMVTSHDSPQAIIFRNCRVNAPLHDASLWDKTNAGGILVANEDTLLDNVRFIDFPDGASYCIRLHPSLVSKAVLRNCHFINCQQTETLIFVHSLSKGVELYGGLIENCRPSLSINAESLIEDLVIKSSGTSIYVGTLGVGTVIDSIRMSNITNARMIFSEAENTVIKDCKLKNLLGDSKFAFIQAEKAGTIIKNNKIDSDEATTAYAISFDVSIGRLLTDNDVGGSLGNTPYYLRNAATYTGAEIRGNKGGAQNISTPISIKGFSSANRPLASTFPQYSSIFDTTLKKIITTNGSGWYDSTGTLVS